MSELPLEISCQNVQLRMSHDEEILLLDCREVEEHSLVNIPIAKLLPMSELQSRHQELLPWKEKPLVVYCHLGMRSAQVATWLREQGFLQAQSMAGGIDRWAVDIDPSLPRY